VPDNPRALVSVACRYDPKLNETVRDFARYYSVSILPARPFSPKDKATAESSVQVVTRWVLARLRHTVLADVHAADAAIAALMPSLNNRAFLQARRQPRQPVRLARCAGAVAAAQATLAVGHLQDGDRAHRLPRRS
jgi:transposase